VQLCPQVLALQPYASLATAKSILAREDAALEHFMARSHLIPSGTSVVGQACGTEALGESLNRRLPEGKAKAEPGIQQKTLLLRLPPHTNSPPGKSYNPAGGGGGGPIL